MKQGIVITTSEATRPFYVDLIQSLDTKYPVFVSRDGIERPHGSFEIGGIRNGAEQFDEFVYLHDTCVIKDNSIFDKLFAIEGHVALSPNFFHYMGKYVTKDLPKFPDVKNKEDAIFYEGRWFQKPFTTFSPVLPIHIERFEEKHGRKNMVIENEYMIKYKATWR